MMTTLIDRTPSQTTPSSVRVTALRHALVAAGFLGDVLDDGVSLAAMSTDNSVYQIAPSVIVAPRSAEDVAVLLDVAGQGPFQQWALTARGGGTGTNGQALNTGIIIDFRRHMNRILALNLEEGWVEVEPGIVLDELNDAIGHTGLFFAPNTSTANRCTIGGMIGTDASGKGSRVFGKTSDNVLGLQVVTADARLLDSDQPSPDWASDLLAEVRAAIVSGRDGLLEKVPKLSRRFTGYDLERALADGAPLAWWRLFIGAEGTLGPVVRARLKLTPKPKNARLIVLAFDDFGTALAAAQQLLIEDPIAIETFDEQVQSLALAAGLLGGLPASVRGDGAGLTYNFVELGGEDGVRVDAQARRIAAMAANLPGCAGAHIAVDAAELKQLWSVRAASVGLLGQARGARRPVAFIEDCVVPPERLSAFVADLRGLLTTQGLSVGIYGHADVGCLHMRPALDMDSATDRARFSALSDGVYALVNQHGGIFWGEHGKGVRGEYLADFVGPVAFAAFERIKRAFDPGNRFNPGKLVSLGDRVLSIANTPMRHFNAGDADPLAKAFECNGNALCLTYAATTPMCPSFKISGDLALSPKGRAEALRAWHRQEAGVQQRDPSLPQDLYASLDACLSCKSCAGGCPTHVDIPEMKSHFLERYHVSHKRPLGDHVALLMERATPILDAFRHPIRVAQRLGGNRMIAALTGLVDLPKLAPRGHKGLGFSTSSWAGASRRAWSDTTVFVFQDSFNALFDTDAVGAICAGLVRLGYHPVILPGRSSGKAAHVKGARQSFLAQAKRLQAALIALARNGRPIVTTDAALALMLRSDYPKAGLVDLPPVLLVEEFLSARAKAGDNWPHLSGGPPQRLFLHCTEASMKPEAGREWVAIFKRLGLGVEIAPTGCCGMSGLFGHERRNADTSKALFDLSWRQVVEASDMVYATGFSCRCQVERLTNKAAQHPMQLIAQS